MSGKKSGAAPSIKVSDAADADAVSQSNMGFTDDELKRLYRRFKKLDADGDGSVSLEEFRRFPQLRQNPLHSRVFSILDANGDGDVEFSEFIGGLSTFSSGSKMDKLQFAFKVYDLNGDGFITNGELFAVLKMMVGNNLTDVQLQQIVDKTILQADKDRDGKISFEDFLSTVGDGDDLDAKLSLSFDPADDSGSDSESDSI